MPYYANRTRWHVVGNAAAYVATYAVGIAAVVYAMHVARIFALAIIYG